jgi:hypothetical protein
MPKNACLGLKELRLLDAEECLFRVDSLNHMSQHDWGITFTFAADPVSSAAAWRMGSWCPETFQYPQPAVDSAIPRSSVRDSGCGFGHVQRLYQGDHAGREFTNLMADSVKSGNW